MTSQWGSLSYMNSQAVTHDLTVLSIEQPQSLDGATAQSRTKLHFYPRSHTPGDIVVSGVCKTQDEYQQLAYYIRKHQRFLLNTPPDQRLYWTTGNLAGASRLMKLDIPTENTYWHGFIKSFGVTKKGVFVPAPTYIFNFFVVSERTANNIGISSRIKSYYNAGSI